VCDGLELIVGETNVLELLVGNVLRAQAQTSHNEMSCKIRHDEQQSGTNTTKVRNRVGGGDTD
jgi:hypothetical protein